MRAIESPVRTLKIEADGDAWKGGIKPKIRLTGRWLELAGFKPDIVAEARGHREDNLLEQVFSRLMTQGTANVPAKQFQQLDCSLSFHSKENNILGVQLADLCAHPCARHILNPGKTNRAFEIARKRIYHQGDISGWKVFP